MKSLWNHQIRAIENAANKSAFAILHEPGCGKTATASVLINQKLRDGVALVVAPISTLENWRDEISTWAPRLQEQIGVAAGTRTRKLKACESKVIITNYESLLTDEIFKELMSKHIDVLVLDECHRCKNYKAKRRARATQLADKAAHKYILTGTPVLNTPMDLWGQIRLLGPQYIENNFFAWRARYFEDKNAGKPGRHPDWQPRRNTVEILASLLRCVSDQQSKAEALDLPPYIEREIRVDLTPAQKRAYATMADAFFAELSMTEIVVADHILTRLIRLLQIASGCIEGQELASNAKLDALEELLEDITPAEKVIVWTCHRPTYRPIQRLCETLKLDPAIIIGDQSFAERNANIAKFKHSPSCRVVIANQAAGGIGINLQEASTAIYYSKNFNLEHDLQSQARNYRGGSEMHNKITRIDLIARDTVDEAVHKALKAKAKIGELLTELKRAHEYTRA